MLLLCGCHFIHSHYTWISCMKYWNILEYSKHKFIFRWFLNWVISLIQVLVTQMIQIIIFLPKDLQIHMKITLSTLIYNFYQLWNWFDFIQLWIFHLTKYPIPLYYISNQLLTHLIYKIYWWFSFNFKILQNINLVFNIFI